MAVWLWTIRAWRRDDSADLSGTMAALDIALSRAEQAAGWVGVGRRRAPEPEMAPADEALPVAASFAPPDVPASPPA